MRALSGYMLISISFLVPRLALGDFSRPLTSGIVYPTIADAANLNPATLMDEHGARAGRLDYQGDTYGYSLAYGNASSSTGFGLVLDTRALGTLTVGGGTTLGGFQLGVNFNLNHTYNPFDGDIGLGVLVGELDGWRASAVLSSVLDFNTSTLTFGIGFAQSSKYQAELNLKVITSALTAAGYNYDQRFMVTRYFGSFGLGAFEKSKASIDPLGLGTMDFGGALQFNFSATTSIDVRYSTATDEGLAFGFLCRL